MGGDSLEKERTHLNKVLLIAVGRAIAKAFPDLVGHWEAILPKHHSHPYSHIKPEEAATRLMPPHYRHEVKINEMVELVVDLQDEMLDMLEEQHPDCKDFSNDLKHIRLPVPPNESPEAKESRVQAEHRVKLFVDQKGERIGHGDLLTFQKVFVARKE